MEINKEILIKIRQNLPDGSYSKLAIQFNFKNPGSIRNILSGRSNNPKVVAAAAALAAASKADVVSTEKEIKDTIKAL